MHGACVFLGFRSTLERDSVLDSTYTVQYITIRDFS